MRIQFRKPEPQPPPKLRRPPTVMPRIPEEPPVIPPPRPPAAPPLWGPPMKPHPLLPPFSPLDELERRLRLEARAEKECERVRRECDEAFEAIGKAMLVAQLSLREHERQA